LLFAVQGPVLSSIHRFVEAPSKRRQKLGGHGVGRD